MIKLFHCLLYYSIIFYATAQSQWERIDMPQNMFIRDIAAKKEGTIYCTIRGKYEIRSFNIFENLPNYVSLNSQNVLNNYPFNPENLNQKSSLTLDCDNSLVTASYGVLFRLINDKLVRIMLLDTSLSSYVNEMSNVKIDNNCRVFFKESNSIKMMNERWNNSTQSISKVFDEGAPVLNFFPYNDSINYSITYKNGITDIYQYNSQSFKTYKLVSIPFQVASHSIILENGDMYLGVEEELYYYSNKGKSLFAPIIDTILKNHGKVFGIYKSESDNSIICFKDPNLFITYDNCNTWHKIYNFSYKFPFRGGVDKFFYWDTNHAVVLSSHPNCDLRELLVINSQNSNWTQVNLEYSNYNFTEITNNNNEFICKYDCNYIKSNNGGRNWFYLNRVNYSHESDFMKFLSLQSNGPIRFSFNYRLDTLYRSLDFGQTWTYNTTIRGISKVFHLSQEELIAVALSNPSVGNVIDFYYSNDNGDHWNLVHENFKSNLNLLMKSDKNGFFYLILSGTNISQVYVSRDKGRTWNLDIRFPKFYINDLFFENDGRCILHAQDNNNIIDIFATYDFNSYLRLDTRPDNYYFSIVRPLGNSRFICAANNLFQPIKGIFYSDDDGNNWKDLTYNLPDFHSKEKYTIVNDMIVDDQGQLNISLTYDGLWRYNTPLVSFGELTNETEIKVYPNPVTDNLMIRINDDLRNIRLKIELYDVLGNKVTERTAIGSTILPTMNLVQGTYFLKIFSDAKLIYSDKIIKY
ncbi:MAG: T9SS type A sorting domain-containing protein [Saprospiraceae bacterium]|nr:T9SS type A sorting domain-containing protein [Saprospiraceae bacterium]